MVGVLDVRSLLMYCVWEQGAFLFGYDCIWNLMKIFFTDTRHVARILVTAYANQRLVSIYYARKEAQAQSKIHVN